MADRRGMTSSYSSTHYMSKFADAERHRQSSSNMSRSMRRPSKRLNESSDRATMTSTTSSSTSTSSTRSTRPTQIAAMNLRDLDGFYACQMCFDPLKFDKTLLDVDMALLHDNFMDYSFEEIVNKAITGESILSSVDSEAETNGAIRRTKYRRELSSSTWTAKNLTLSPSTRRRNVSESETSASPDSLPATFDSGKLSQARSPTTEHPLNDENDENQTHTMNGNTIDHDDQSISVESSSLTVDSHSLTSTAQSLSPSQTEVHVPRSDELKRSQSSSPRAVVVEHIVDAAPPNGNVVDTPQHVVSVREAVSRLYIMAQRATDALQPLCASCANTCLVDVKQQLDTSAAQLMARMELSGHVDSEIRRFEHDGATVAELTRQCDTLARSHQALLEELAKLDATAKELENDDARLVIAEKRLDEAERAHFLEVDSISAERRNIASRRSRADIAYERCQRRLQVLACASVYNDAFYIWHAGHFATINGQRLGRLPSQQVNWRELNAAFGLAAAAAATLRGALGARFRNGRRLLGGGSFVRVVDDGGTLMELYGSSEFSLGRLFWYRRFDNALVTFLQCIADLEAHCRAVDPSFRLPYPIKNDKIGNDPPISIKTKLGDDETWTRALKFLLTDLKWLILFVSKEKAFEQETKRAKAIAQHKKLLLATNNNVLDSPNNDNK